MTEFEQLFATTSKNIKTNCLLLPFLTKDLLKNLGVGKLSKGKLYSSADQADFSLIYTGIGASRLGDAVLYLKETDCQNIILLGACGLVKGSPESPLGSLVCPTESLSLESFSQVLSKDTENQRTFKASNDLIESYFKLEDSSSTKKVRCASFGSLKLEEENMEVLTRKNVDVLDMECSACFSAAAHIDRKALGLLFISDIIGERPFFATPAPQENLDIQSGILKVTGLILSLMKSLK